MRRDKGRLSGIVVEPISADYAATDKTTVVVAGWHPPSYMTWQRVNKAQVTHYACSAGTEDVPSAWIYPQAIDVCGGGFVQLVRWAALEPTQNNYVFTFIETALEWLSANKPGAVLFVRVKWKSYTSSNGATNFLSDTQKNLPAYLDGHVYQVYQNGSPSGFGPKQWTQFVQDRIIALVNALGAAFSSNPSFGGVIFDESTLSMSWPWPVDYDFETSIGNVKAALKAAQATMPSKIVVQPVNYVDAGDLSVYDYSLKAKQFVEWCVDNGIQLALVDTCPTTPAFLYSMSEVLISGSPIFAIVDAGERNPRHGGELADVTGNFLDIATWAGAYENVSAVFWPISNANCLAALTEVLS